MAEDGRFTCWGTNNTYSQHPVMAITPGVLPAATVGVPYDATLVFAPSNASVRPPYSARTPVWVVDGDLPDGLGLDDTGVLSGTPTESGSFTFTVIAEDANGFTAEATYTLEL